MPNTLAYYFSMAHLWASDRRAPRNFSIRRAVINYQRYILYVYFDNYLASSTAKETGGFISHATIITKGYLLLCFLRGDDDEYYSFFAIANISMKVQKEKPVAAALKQATIRRATLPAFYFALLYTGHNAQFSFHAFEYNADITKSSIMIS